MIALKETILIPAPLDRVWPLLSDPALVASCVPGAAFTSRRPDGVYEGTIAVKFGPTVAKFRGEATLTYDHAEHRCKIEGRGLDQRGASRALATGVVTASGTESTTLGIEGGFNVTGPLETFANAGGVHVARALLAEFAANIAKLVAERQPAAAVSKPEPAPATAKQEAAPIGAGRLLWMALRAWFTKLFARSTTGGSA